MNQNRKANSSQSLSMSFNLLCPLAEGTTINLQHTLLPGYFHEHITLLLRYSSIHVVYEPPPHHRHFS